jgi:hypothetical protein
MSEWLKALAWKATLATLTDVMRKHLFAQSLQRLPARDAAQCEPVNVAVYQRLRGGPYTISTRFSSSLAPVRPDVLRRASVELIRFRGVQCDWQCGHTAGNPGSIPVIAMDASQSLFASAGSSACGARLASPATPRIPPNPIGP